MIFLVIATFLLAPAYVVRFQAGPFPVNLLLLWLAGMWLAFAAWIYRGRLGSQFAASLRQLPRPFIWLAALFFLSGLAALFIGGFSQAKLGQFIVLFLEPISVYAIAYFTAQKYPQTRGRLTGAFYLFVAACGALAVLQYFWLVALPPAWWGNSQEPKRAIGLFAHPDAFALFLTPLLAFLLPDAISRLQNIKSKINMAAVGAWVVGVLGLVLSLSRGGWFGLLAAAAVYTALKFKKRYLPYAAIALVLLAGIVYSNTTLRYRLILPFYGEKSAVARLSLWSTGVKMIKDAPILGKGLQGFNNNWYAYNTDPGLEHYNSPHNLFLNFWVDTGLLGMVSFVGLACFMAYRSWRSRSLYGYGVLLFLVALAVHGMIDTPYLKNDLALELWLVLAMLPLI